VKAVVVDKFVPSPPDSGGKRRSLALLERLAQRMPVTLCAFARGDEDLDVLQASGITVRAVPWQPGTWRSLVGLGRTRSVTAARFYDPRLAAQVRDACKEDDLLVVEYTQMADYARAVPARHKVLDMHNVESDLMQSYAASRRGPRAWVASAEGRALRGMEDALARDFDHVVCVSERDGQLLSQRGIEATVCRNGWNPRSAPLEPSAEPLVVFVALMGWAPNVDAARWLGEQVWPIVRRQHPAARLALVGKDPTAAVLALATADVEVTGTVASVEPWLRRAQVAVAPLRAGGGSRLKILEALDAGRPLVSTSKGLEGLEDLEGDGVLVADEPHDMAAAVIGLLQDPARASQSARAAPRPSGIDTPGTRRGSPCGPT
jgi:hypothetical protein